MSESSLKAQLLAEQLAEWTQGPPPPRITPRTVETLEAIAAQRRRPDPRLAAWAGSHGRSEPVPAPSWVSRCEKLMSSAAMTVEGLAAKAGIEPDRLRDLFAGGPFAQSEMARIAAALRVPVSALLEAPPLVPPAGLAYLNSRKGARS
jgi:hypothetical protein